MDPAELDVIAQGGALTQARPCAAGPCDDGHAVAWIDALDHYVDAAAAVYERKGFDRIVAGPEAQRARGWLGAALDVAYLAHHSHFGADRVPTLVDACQRAEGARLTFAGLASVSAAGGGSGVVAGLTVAGGLALLLVALATAWVRGKT